MIPSDEPFLRPIPKRWISQEMTTAPALDAARPERAWALCPNEDETPGAPFLGRPLREKAWPQLVEGWGFSRGRSGRRASAQPAGQVELYYALLLNPFYPKDANASYGKHVLTPTLALTSFAATTPKHWRVDYWDENLLDGRPPYDPMPQVVGITVHLTFAKRAYALADW
jgi:hypothetical protein